MNSGSEFSILKDQLTKKWQSAHIFAIFKLTDLELATADMHYNYMAATSLVHLEQVLLSNAFCDASWILSSKTVQKALGK